MLRRLHPAGDEGALAVMVAILAVVLFGLAALAMDLGNAFSRNRDVQFQADFAALAGGSELPAPSLDPQPTDLAIVKAATYVFENMPQDDDATDFADVAAVAVALTDDVATNGEAYYGHLDPVSGALIPSAYELTIRTPPALVKYGFAAIIGHTDGEVNAYATVGIQSPGSGTMPFFAVNGCDYGPQVLSDPANGQAQSIVPPMQFPTDTNKARLVSITPPAQVNVNADPAITQTITINGQFLAGVTKVGFFRDTALTPNFFETAPFANSDSTGNTVANVQVPIGVTSVEDVWWVRVWGPPNGSGPDAWSTVSEALPLRVGESLLECAGSSNDGNFGSLKLPRSSNPSTWLPDNVALGLEAPLSLAVYPGSPPPDLCTNATSPPKVESTAGSLRPGTNCVDTDTGLPANALTQGLITGSNARLDQDTTTDCSPQRNSSRRTVAIGGGYNINDDTLSCFLTTSASVGTISSPTYSGPAVLSPDIYSSPRFFWVPVFNAQPGTGGAQRYSIIDFRPAFITSDAPTSTKGAPVFRDSGSIVSASATNNGLTVSNNGITRMKVVFFNSKALPNDAGGAPTVAYMGVGPKILVMTN